MPSRGSRVRVLCEDGQHEAFARRLLEDVFHIHRNAIDVEKAPKGEGAASNWVVRRYCDSIVPLHRRTRNQRNLGFVIMVDGDNVGFKGRMAALQAEERTPEDRIAILAPTWSIETWVLWLRNEQVGESEQTKARLSSDDFRRALRDAITRWQAPPREGELPSLAQGRVELMRLP